MAEDIRITGENAQCDEARKRLLSTKEILAHILKACVEEYRLSGTFLPPAASTLPSVMM